MKKPQPREGFIEPICEYLINCYNALPSTNQNNSPTLAVLVDTTADIFSPIYDIPQSIAGKLTKEKGKGFAQAITGILLGYGTKLSHKINLIYNPNIHSDPKDLVQLENVGRRWEENRQIHRGLNYRAELYWDHALDKKLLFVHPSTCLSWKMMDVLENFYDQIFPWEWEAQNEGQIYG